MVDIDIFRTLALSFPDTAELPHFEKTSFRVKNKIFATYWEKEDRAMLLLPIIEQSVFCGYDSSVFFPVPGAWGKKGATLVELKKVRKDIFKDAVTVAYNSIALKKR